MNDGARYPICSLPRPTSAQLRSAVVIPSFPQILNELVQNALDAGATKISCQIDLSQGYESIRVEDDGHGLDDAQFSNVGTPHASSKRRSSEAMAALGSYGFRGEGMCLLVVDCEVTDRQRCPLSPALHSWK